jgi:hypothetical protein
MVSLERTHGMLTIAVSAGLFTVFVKPSLPRSLPSITRRLKTSLPKSLSSAHCRLVGMLTITVSAGLFTACVEPSLPRSLPSITTRLKTSLPRSMSSITTRLAYFGITGKFGNCFALRYSSGTMSLDLEDIKVTDEPRSRSMVSDGSET